jgi:tyrosine-protein kinase Etk/Wzc
MRVVLTGDDPELLAETLNGLVAEYVVVAADLKTRNLVEFTRALEEQVEYASRELNAAEMAVENFRVNTITLPTDGVPVAAGPQMTRNPVFASFFNEKIELENVRRDRAALERTIAAVQNGGGLNTLWSIPAVQTLGRDLTASLNDYTAKEAVLRSLRQTYTDAHQPIIDQQRVLDDLRMNTIVPLATALAGQLRVREGDLEGRIATASRELQEIPTRAIEELKLERNREARENLFITLKNRFEEARLAQRSSLPDVTPLDPAVAPSNPVRTTAARILMMAVLGSLGLAIVVAILLDRLDRRFRYPEQATTELGLPILGAVPTIPKNLDLNKSTDDVVQVVEAFRSIRLAMSHALDPFGPKVVTVTSPGMGDGKSLVSANLAMAFASAGLRTVLIDGDTRRGALHTVFGFSRTPGLLDVLSGDVALDVALRAAGPENLMLLPSGTRSRRGPELLQSPTLRRALDILRKRFDVVIVDSPPLSAGVDAFVLAAATGNVALVLRTGATDRKLAKAKLELVDRLPTNVVGAVLNDIRTEGVYKYYSYIDGYESFDEPVAAVAAGDDAPRIPTHT